MRELSCGLLGLAVVWLAGGEVLAGNLPQAVVSKIPTGVMTEAGGLTLDVARCFSVSPDEAALREYGDWIADFVISADRAVNAGDIKLYGQLDVFGDKWTPFDLPMMNANEGVRLLGMDEISYAVVQEEFKTFRCGAKSAMGGMTITVDFRLYEPDPADPENPASISVTKFSYRFPRVRTEAWFDADIPHYAAWPADAARALGGSWSAAGKTLAEAADLPEMGVLSVLAPELAFVAETSKEFGSDIQKAVFESVVDLAEYVPDCLPAVDPTWKGGVMAVRENGGTGYYGLVRQGNVNAWAKLTPQGVQPEVTPVALKMSLWRKNGKSFVSYEIGGTPFAHAGQTEIPIVANKTVGGVAYGGCGEVYGLSANVVLPQSGFVLSLH